LRNATPTPQKKAPTRFPPLNLLVSPSVFAFQLGQGSCHMPPLAIKVFFYLYFFSFIVVKAFCAKVSVSIEFKT